MSAPEWKSTDRGVCQRTLHRDLHRQQPRRRRVIETSAPTDPEDLYRVLEPYLPRLQRVGLEAGEGIVGSPGPP
jgi:hypothetical protein